MRILKSRVAIRETPPATTTASGIYTGEEPTTRIGKVILAGKGDYSDNGTFIKNPIKKGMTVVWGKDTGAEVDFLGETLIELNSDEIMWTE